MASHTLAIAKASFAASLMRPDPTTVPRSEIAEFHDHFDALLQQCSSANIQLCKDWLLKNITHSKTRTVALGKYFAATSSSFVKESDSRNLRFRNQDVPPTRRRQLHILFLLNDLLHHVEFHADSPAAKITLVESLPSHLLEILQLASTHSLEAFPRHHAKIQDLIEIWAKQAFYPSPYIQKLRDTAANATKTQKAGEKAAEPLNGIQEDPAQLKRDAPYIMPPSHGDPSVPFYDLPAGNMMPLIIPNSTAPINPESMKPLQFMTGPADPKLAATIEEFLKSVDTLDTVGLDDDDAKNDIDELGQPVLREAMTGEMIEGDAYYGWSRAFCEKMKNGGDIMGFGTNLARDDSRSESRSPQRRRRYSSSQSYSSINRGRPGSRSRSPSLERQHRRVQNFTTSRSRSPPTDHWPRGLGSAYGQPLPPPLYPQGPSPPPPPPFTQGFPLGPGGVPIPPRPAGYNGAWPPPPPPFPPPGSHAISPFTLSPGNQGFPNRDGWGQQPLASNQGDWVQQITSSDPGHSHPYGIPPQGQPPPPPSGNFQSSGIGRAYGRGGWAR